MKHQLHESKPMKTHKRIKSNRIKPRERLALREKNANSTTNVESQIVPENENDTDSDSTVVLEPANEIKKKFKNLSLQKNI